jgi:hypothetical protein
LIKKISKIWYSNIHKLIYYLFLKLVSILENFYEDMFTQTLPVSNKKHFETILSNEKFISLRLLTKKSIRSKFLTLRKLVESIFLY